MPVLSTLGAAIANVYGFTSGLIKDQYFNLVSLLLPGNGTNGAQNNTFLDGSSNNFTITRNGNTTQGTFSPFSQTGWGAYFDGSNDYVSNSTLNSSYAGDFTFEAWVYISSLTSNMYFFGQGSETTNRWVFGTTSAGRLFANPYGGADIFFGSNGDVTAGSWLHIAFVRSGSGANNITGYVNGQSKGTGTSTATVGNSGGFGIGAGQNGSGPVNGYMSNVRYTAQAIYTNNFTPSVVPLTQTSQGASSSNVKVLALQSNRFIDNAATPNTLTANNGVAITPFSPFAPTQSYSASAVGGSGYFDGTGDYLSIADNAAFTMGTGDFTVEAWVYCTATDFASSRYIIAQRNASADTSISFAMNFVGGGARKVRLLCFDSGGASYEAACATDVLNLNEWTHIAGVRNGATLRIYVNGVQQGTANISTASLVDSDGGVAIGRLGDANFYYWLGYISNVRVTKGGCLYPSGTTFTPPTAPLTTTVSAGTVSLLTNFTNAGVVDATAKNVLETVGNAQISTTQSKWGGGSIRFDGTGDAARIPDDEKENLRFGTGNFTIEFWAWKSANGSMNYDTVISIGSTGSYNGGFSVELSASRGFCFIYDNAVRIQSNFNPNDSTWNHYAVVRDGSTFALYKNGSRLTTATLTPTLGITGTAYVGAGALNDNSFNGYIDDLRVTKGLARYTGTTYTTPTAPFPVQ